MEVVLTRDRPDLEQAIAEAFRERWPEFIFHDALAKEYLPRVQEYFRGYDIWEEWTGMLFPASGDYVVPDALDLVHVDREADCAVYREENLWVEHRGLRAGS